jgi:hypothetical protein
MVGSFLTRRADLLGTSSTNPSIFITIRSLTARNTRGRAKINEANRGNQNDPSLVVVQKPSLHLQKEDDPLPGPLSTQHDTEHPFQIKNKNGIAGDLRNHHS